MVREGMMLAERYEIISRIGAGGMSDVYRAKDHKLNRFVAIKILKSEFSDNKSFVAKFRTEAQSAAGLVHPNIVNVYDVGEEFGLYYIVMELVEGITLKHYIEKKLRLSVKEATSIAIQMAMGLEAAHANHVIHRDVKPQNIIISREGKVKVTDFGIARAATSDTITSSVMGSVHYTSPEQARGGYSDEKSDIYSLGIVLFEMVTGRVPFDGETTVNIAIKQIQDPMPNPRDFVNDIPVSVEHIIYKCCEKNPDRRYSSMTELIADLKRSLVKPDEDFVKMIPSGGIHGATKTVSQKDINEIKRSTGNIDLDEDMLRAYEMQKRRSRAANSRGSAEGPGYTEVYEDDTRRPARPREYEDMEPEPEERGRTGRRKPSNADRNAYRPDQEEKRRGRNSRRPYNEEIDEDIVEDEEDMDPRLQKLMTALGVIAALIIVIIIIVLIGKIRGLSVGGGSGSTDASSTESTNSTDSSEDGSESESGDSGNADSGKVTLTDVRGMVFAEAKTSLTALGLVVTSENMPSDTVEKGRVISVSNERGDAIEPGDSIASGSTVILEVSAGRQGSSIPSVVGMSRAEAKVALANQGFTMAETTES
ncbi:MAG: protein kinase, partial [Lachnospiraceae bacterium]|nr:protein kinase [Lachnospiraceae bacterium]